MHYSETTSAAIVYFAKFPSCCYSWTRGINNMMHLHSWKAMPKYNLKNCCLQLIRLNRVGLLWKIIIGKSYKRSVLFLTRLYLLKMTIWHNYYIKIKKSFKALILWHLSNCVCMMQNADAVLHQLVNNRNVTNNL